jgi:hypothetical protein
MSPPPDFSWITPPTIILTSLAVLVLAAPTERADAGTPVTVYCSGDVTSQITTPLTGTLSSGGTLDIVNPIDRQY